MAENIDIYNANLEPLGQMDRKQAHMEGQWHRTFHLWLASRAGGDSLLFQLRSPTVANYPSALDITAAGHLLSGESVEQGLREVKEELGIDIPLEDIHSLGYRVEVADQDNGQLNREYQAVYLALTELDPRDFKPDPEEVYGIVAVPLRDCFRLFTGELDQVKARGISFDSEQNHWTEHTRQLAMTDFIPRIQSYYLTVAIMAERLIEGRRPLAIS